MRGLDSSKLGNSGGFDHELARMSPRELDKLTASGRISAGEAFAYLMAGLSTGDAREAFEAWLEVDATRAAKAPRTSFGLRLLARRAVRGQ